MLEAISEASSDVKLILDPRDFGGCAIDKYGDPLPEETLEACKRADAILMGKSRCILSGKAKDTVAGSIGGPKWGPTAKVRPEPGLLRLRQELGLYANVRPASFASDSLVSYSPLKAEVAKGVNIIVVRELIGGLYYGPREEQGDGNSAYDTMVYSVAEVERITRVAAQIALTANPPLMIHSIDKANVLASSRLWRKVVTETLTQEYPQIKFQHQFVDTAAMNIVGSPRKLNGVVLTENLFGDM